MPGRPVRSAAGHLATPALSGPLWWSRLWRAAHDAKTARTEQFFHATTKFGIDRNGALAIEQDVTTVSQFKAKAQRFIPRVAADDFAKRRQ
jgi:hypothetical protein